jgi:hypothetical protein
MAHLAKIPNTDTWYLADDWHIEDVISVREDLTEDQAAEVLSHLADNFDANNGINWEVIKYTADYLYPLEED